MPNWKKVITSGSDALLKTIQVTGNITPSSDNTQTLGTTSNRFQLNGGTPVTVGGSGTADQMTRFSAATEVENSTISNTDTLTTVRHTNDGNKIFVVSGSNGELVSISDEVSNELLRVNDTSGIGVFIVSASGDLNARNLNQSTEDFVLTYDSASGAIHFQSSSIIQGVSYSDSDVTDHIDSLAVVSGSDSQVRTFLNVEDGADVTDTTNVVAALTGGTNVNIAADGTISSTDTNTQLSTAEVRGKFSGTGIDTSTGVITDTNTQLSTADVRGKFSAGTNVSITNGVISSTDTNTDTQRSDEEIRDVASAQWTNGTNTTVVKDDANNTIKINSVDTNTQLSTAEVRGKFSGTGIDTSTGVITNTNTQLSTADVRGKFSAGTNVSITNGVISSTDTNTVYTHPTFNGDDFSVDTGALTGATIISDLDINVTTDGNGHVTDANGTVATRTLTLGDLGYTGATNANNITNNNQLTNGAGYITSFTNTVDMGDGFKIANSAGTDQFTVTENEEIRFAGSGATSVSFDSATQKVTISSTDTNTVYTHPTFNGDDFSVDTGALTGATVVSDIDINVTTDGNGHVTDANGAVSTRTLTLGDLGYTGATNANYITNNNQLTNGAGYITSFTNDDVSVANLKTRLAGGFGSNAVQIGDSTDTVTIPGNLTVQGTQTINNVNLINTSNGVVFEGTTDDGFETTLTATDPTADRAINLPNAAGTVALTSDLATVGDGGLTQKNFTTTLKNKLDGIATSANNYTHPAFNGDDFSIDTGALTGATVISDLDINVTTNGNGHVTDANGAVSTRTLTLGDLGYTGATNANNYTHPTFNGDDFSVDTGALTGATVVSDIDINVTTDGNGHVTDANGSVATRTLTLANLGYTGATNATANTGTVDTSGTPVDNDFAKFTDANTVEGRSYSEVKSDLGLTTTSAVRFDQLGIGVAQTGTSGRLKVNEHAIVNGNVYTSGNEGLVFGTSTSEGEYIKRSGNDIQMFAGSTNVLTVDGDNSRVGIGTDSPDTTLHISGASDVLLVEGSGSTVFEVQGSEGQLFSITDDLTGDLFSVSDISGIPLFNVNASDESYFTGQLEVQGLLTGSTADFGTSVTLDTFVMSDSTDRTGLILVDNNRSSATWSGHQYTNDSGQLWSIFGNNADFGLYDDTSNEWILQYNINGSVELYHNGAKKVETAAGGIAVSGAITATGDITAYYSSDRRLKENIKPIENATEKIKKIGGYEFDWKPNDNPEMIHEGHDIGVIAQEVEAVLPEIVQDRDNGYKAVEYQKLVALLIESNKELAARVEELEKKLQ